jgi:hypothetical protein
MALTLIKEDGTGKVDANSYADMAAGDAYHDGHLYAAAWTGASNDDKEKALVFATRLIDAEYQFNGFRGHDEQALQWPRERCVDPDKGVAAWPILLPRLGTYVANDVVPKAVVDATCELARELLIADRTAAPAGEGIHSAYTAHTVSGGISDISNTTYDKSDTRPIISKVAQAMLGKFGVRVGEAGGAVRLVRT